MKTSRSTTNKQNKQGNSRKPKPDIRDDMDSRQRREGGTYKKTNKKETFKKVKKAK
jgi:hypothetical protein